MILLNKKIFNLVILAVVFFGGLIFMHQFEIVERTRVILAEDDEEDERDEEDEDHEEDDEDEKVEIQSTKTETKYIKLSDTVSTKTTVITKYDSDGDGILDEKDAYPTINDNFMVEDADLNGIDDKYEK